MPVILVTSMNMAKGTKYCINLLTKTHEELSNICSNYEEEKNRFISDQWDLSGLGAKAAEGVEGEEDKAHGRDGRVEGRLGRVVADRVRHVIAHALEHAANEVG